ncbi:MAG: copper amine oxidase N-terminal domain-containing protein, partial [Clostridia bacterium]|nr:copper amine oxidase N-terminal domain-containing protein [Clostridia bacterium]
KKVDLDQPACIIDERTLVPVRAISEAYGTTVDWDQAAKTVVIKTSDYVETPVIHYDDITANVNQIKDMISRGLYVEAMQECENAKNWHNLSPDDIALVDSLYKTAETKYNEYLENSKPVYTSSAFDSLKNSIINKGTYSSKYSKYSIDRYNGKTLTTLDYKPAKDEINISVLTETSNSTGFTSLTIRRNTNTTGGYIFESSSSEYMMLFEYRNGSRVILSSEFPSYLSSNAIKVVDSAILLFDSMLKLYTNVTLADFGVYY